MAALAILLALQTVAVSCGIYLLWRRLRAIERDTSRQRAMVEPMDHRASNAEAGEVARVVQLPLTPRHAPLADGTPDFSNGVICGVLLAAAAAAPAICFAFGLGHGWIVAAGYLVGAAMMILALGRQWSAAAWAGVMTVAVWTMLGIVLGVDLTPAALALAIAGLCGVIHARLRALVAGGAMALTAAAALLFWSAQNGTIGAYGGAFAVLVAGAAMAGAHPRSEPVHLGAFVAALVGLFVLSGENVAAVWFTPIAAWVGALFFAIAAVGVPVAGARAATLAGTGVLAPLLAAGMLHRANHALAAPWAAGVAFLVIATCASILLAATLRRHRPAKLGLTHWLLGLGAFVAAAIGIGYGLGAALATTAFAGLAVALVSVDERWPMALWRLLASLAALFAIVHGVETARFTLAEQTLFSPVLTMLAGPTAAASLFAFALYLASRSNAKALTTTALETTVFVLAMLAAHVLLRLVFSDGAPVLKPFSFVEACAHVSVWLVAALLIGARSNHPARTATALTLTLAAGIGALVIGLLWFTPYWTERAGDGPPHPALGFLLVSACFWAHWALWRARADDTPTRAALAAAGFSAASAAMVWLLGVAFMPVWMKAGLSAFAFTLAIALNFAPGVTAGAYEMQRFRRSSAAR